ncbi:hypothetical protein [Microcoleus sp. F4-D5]|uniref:hypothetical protein n=1 Tax=Microcoleus sp. F4-D5 TaxID=2818760 RepID=UPI002FCFEE9F
MPPHESSAFPKNLSDPKLLPGVEVDEMLTRIKHSHGHYYKMMNLEVWALVETLDGLFPGAWGQFMTNRQIAVKQFLERDRHPTNFAAVDKGDAGDAGDEQEGGRPLDSFPFGYRQGERLGSSQVAQGKKNEEATSQESGNQESEVRNKQEEE